PDDDCIPDPNWVTAMVGALQHVDVVQGATMPDPVRFAGSGPFARRMCIEKWSGHFETCNVGYRRAVIERLDGFDEQFRRPWCEDVDLGYRAVEAGADTAFVGEALVIHDVEHTTTLADYRNLLRDRLRKVFTPRLTRLHPRYRE